MRESSLRSAAEGTVDRRRVLGATAAVLSGGLAGCLAPGAPEDCRSTHPPPNGIELRNGDPDEYSVAVEVVQDRLVSAPTVFERTVELDTTSEGRVVRIGDIVEVTGRYVITATLESDPQTVARHLWTVSPDRCDAVRIEISDGRLAVTEPGGLGIL